MKPEKIPFFTFYWTPVVRLIGAITAAVISFYRRLAGRWYCEYCRQYHSRRTRRYYSVCTWERDYWCSLSPLAPGQPPAPRKPFTGEDHARDAQVWFTRLREDPKQ